MGDLIYGNIYDKYGSKNPIVKILMANYLRNIDELINLTKSTEIHEVGCGEGRLGARYAKQGYKVRGSDSSPEVIKIAEEEAKGRDLDISFKAAGNPC